MGPSHGAPAGPSTSRSAMARMLRAARNSDRLAHVRARARRVRRRNRYCAASSTMPDHALPDVHDAALAPIEAAESARRWWGRHLHEMRWQAELARLLVDPVFQGHGVPRGDGRPVVLIPGFLAGDGSLSVMRGWLDRIGYEAHGSDILCNVDCSDRAVRRLEAKTERIVEAAGRPAAVIGHSRG